MSSVMLPISIDDVSYYNDAFLGDLIITHGVIYFFPNTVAPSKELRRVEVIGAIFDHFGPIGSALSLFIDLLAKELRTINNSALHKSGLWKQFESEEQFKSKIDGYIEAVAGNRKPEEFSSSLPRPIRFSRDEIGKLRVTFRGKVMVETTYDNHDFGVGLKRKRVLVEALREGNLISPGTV